MSLYVLPTLSYLTLATRVEFDAATKLSENCKIAIALRTKWACGAAGSALPWHGRGRRFDPDQVHQTSQQLRPGERVTQNFVPRCRLFPSIFAIPSRAQGSLPAVS